MIFRTAVINFGGVGDNTVIASTGTPINIYGVAFTVAGATNITYKDGSTNLSGSMVFTGNGSSMTLPIQGDAPWFQVTAGNAFIINSTAGVSVQGIVWYALG